MSKPHRFSAGGLSFTQHQWDFLRKIPAEERLSLFTPKDQSLARSLAEIGVVRIDPGIRNAPASRQADPSLPIWHVATTAGLTDLGRACVSGEPEDLAVAAKAAAAARMASAEAKVAAKDALMRARAQRLYSKVLSDGMPLTLAMLPAYKQSIVRQCLIGLSRCSWESREVVLLQIVHAWNWGIYHAIPKNRNPLFLELRTVLPFLEDRAGFVDARTAVDALLQITPRDTTAYALLLKADAFLDEVSELLPKKARKEPHGVMAAAVILDRIR